jgi:hypothetical protein
VAALHNAEADPAENKKDIDFKSEKLFIESLSSEELSQAKTVTLSVRNDEAIDWKMWGDGEEIEKDEAFEAVLEGGEAGPTLAPHVTFGDKSQSEVFFEYFFPSVEGFGKTNDAFYTDHRAPGNYTVRSRFIKFHDPVAIDADWKVKQCVLLLMAGATEPYHGASKYWKRGPGFGMNAGRIPYPDFGRYASIAKFQTFKTAFPKMWADPVHCWYDNFGETTWDMFDPHPLYHVKRLYVFECAVFGDPHFYLFPLACQN